MLSERDRGRNLDPSKQTLNQYLNSAVWMLPVAPRELAESIGESEYIADVVPGHLPKRFRVRADPQAIAITPPSATPASEALTQLAKAGVIGMYVGTCRGRRSRFGRDCRKCLISGERNMACRVHRKEPLDSSCYINSSPLCRLRLPPQPLGVAFH
jgi:hypothetical protein